METIRIDKYLWAVRLFKTRSEAADACKNNRVKMNGVEVKASRDVKVGDVITLRKLPVIYTYKVLALIENRQPAKNVPLYISPRRKNWRNWRSGTSAFLCSATPAPAVLPKKTAATSTASSRRWGRRNNKKRGLLPLFLLVMLFFNHQFL